MARRLMIDIVSDVVCPWCAIGLAGLETALDRLAGEIDADLALHPFELNPDLPPEGENGLEHVALKYGISADQVRANRLRIEKRAAEVGVVMRMSDASRIWNTFDAHRLLAWAGEKGHQLELERQLFKFYFTEQRNVSDHDTLPEAAVVVGLSDAEAREMLSSQAYAEQVRSAEDLWRKRGIDSVPAFVVDGTYLISGGQPPEEFERQLRIIAGAS